MAEGDKMRGKRIRKPETWTTENEISYLGGIGTWCLSITLSRKQMLENYIKSTFVRREWGEVSKVVVRSYALEMLREL